MALPNAIWGESIPGKLDQTNQSPAQFRTTNGNTVLIGPDGEEIAVGVGAVIQME